MVNHIPTAAKLSARIIITKRNLSDTESKMAGLSHLLLKRGSIKWSSTAVKIAVKNESVKYIFNLI
jgi:hypothetical protein